MARPVLGGHSLTLDHAPTATGTRLLGAASVPGHGVPNSACISREHLWLTTF